MELALHNASSRNAPEAPLTARKATSRAGGPLTWVQPAPLASAASPAI